MAVVEQGQMTAVKTQPPGSAIDVGYGEDIKAGASPGTGSLISRKSQLEC